MESSPSTSDSSPGSGETLCGLWVDMDGRVHLSVANGSGGREERVEAFRPFAWLPPEPVTPGPEGIELAPLAGEGAFTRMLHGQNLETFDRYLAQIRETTGVDVIRPLESQYLLQHRQRLFRDMTFGQLRRCQFDIETGSSLEGTFSDAAKADDRVLAIGLQFGTR